MSVSRPIPSAVPACIRPAVLRPILILLGLLPALAVPVGAATTVGGFDTLPELSGLEARWQEVMDLFDTPGMAVAVVRNDSIHVATLGFRDPDTRAPVTPETMFYIASVTKTMTAADICALAGGGKLALDAPVHTLLPRLRLPDAGLLEHLTVADLLCHRYGINSGPAVTLDAYTGGITEDRYYHWLAEATIAGKIDYTNVHYTLLGRVIDAVTGRSWRDDLQARLFEPAGMTRTTAYASRLWMDPDHAVPTARDGEGWRAIAQRKTDRTMHAAGGVATTAVDGGRWLLLFLDHGTLDGRRVLPVATVDSMLTVHARFDEPDGTIRVIEGIGDAWQVGTFNGHRLAMHSGGYTGAGAHGALLPDDGVGVFVLVNAGGPAQGLATIAAVDALERLTGTTSPWSVYDRYVERMRMAKAEGKGPPPTPEAALLPLAAVTRPGGLYEGAFRNPWWGTLLVTRGASGFAIRLGDYPLSTGPVEGEPDAFVAGDAFGEGAVGRFAIDPNGTVERVVVTDPERGEIVFTR